MVTKIMENDNIKPIQQSVSVIKAGKIKEDLLPIPNHISNEENINKDDLAFLSINKHEDKSFDLIFHFRGEN